MNREIELREAIKFCYGEVPREWESSLEGVELQLSKLPPLSIGRPMPFITYFLFQLNRNSTSRVFFLNALMYKESQELFIKATSTFAEEAEVEAVLDEKNFKSEMDAFGNVEEALTNPHLDISPLYRYIAALQQSYSFLIDDALYSRAKKAILANPYRFFAYGEENMSYMPITFEGVYGGYL